jgi:hypothetical protein
MALTDDGTYLDDDHRHVTVVDRFGPGGDIRLKTPGFAFPGVLYWDQKPHAIQPKFLLRGPPAKQFFRYGSSAYVKLPDGELVCRLGVEGGDPDLIQELKALAEDVTNCDPIDVDLEAVEGWDTASIDPANERKQTKKLKVGKRESMAALRAREEA